jgi:hypothetical protein
MVQRSWKSQRPNKFSDPMSRNFRIYLWTHFLRGKNMANPILSSLLVPHQLYAQAVPGWGTATSIGNNFKRKAQVPKLGMNPHGDAMAV